jgi:hypothetical protein
LEGRPPVIKQEVLPLVIKQEVPPLVLPQEMVFYLLVQLYLDPVERE